MTPTTAWPTRMFNAQRIGSVPDRFVPPLRLVWKYERGDYIYHGQIIANGLVYIAGAKLRALDLATGALRWEAPIRTFGASFAWDDTIAAPGHGDSAGVWILDAHDGTLLRQIASSFVLESFCLTDGRLYWLENDRLLRAADPTTGAILWTYPYRYQRRITPAAQNGLLYCEDWYRVYTLDAATGTVQWEWEYSGAHSGVKEMMAVDGDTVFVPIKDFGVVALDAYTGHVRWRSAERQVRAAVAVTSEYVYAILRHLCALDRQTGEPVWVYDQHNPRPQWRESAPIIVGDHLYIGGGHDGHFYAFDRHTGEKLWEYLTGDIVFSSPVYADGRLVIGSHDGFIYCFEQAEA